jgi:hypothetical protein
MDFLYFKNHTKQASNIFLISNIFAADIDL